MSNPYDPQSPAKPHYFGGRKQILKIFKESIDKAQNEKQSGGILAYGYRGVGKTSLLRKMKDLVCPDNNLATNNIIAICRRLTKTTSDSDLYQILTEDILEEITQRRTIFQKIQSATSNIKSAKVLEVELEITDPKPKTPYYQWRNIVKNIKNADCILVEIDDADYLSIEALGELKTIVEEENPTPVLLIVSGGIEFESKLVDDYSPIARIFSGASFNLGEFTIDETKEVLEKPIENTNTTWDDTGIKAVQKISRGYPYLVQCLGKAAYIERGAIDEKRVNSCLNSALELGKTWLNNELKNASDIDIASFLKITELTSETIQSAQMNALGISPPYIGRLVTHGIIEQISRGRYKLKKPPIIALYHSLKRGLNKTEEKIQQTNL